MARTLLQNYKIERWRRRNAVSFAPPLIPAVLRGSHRDEENARGALNARAAETTPVALTVILHGPEVCVISAYPEAYPDFGDPPVG
jgi:hypothetical protein